MTGITLAELLIAVVVVPVLAAIALPAYQNLGSNLNTDIQYAGSEAVRRKAAVSVSLSATTTRGATALSAELVPATELVRGALEARPLKYFHSATNK